MHPESLLHFPVTDCGDLGAISQLEPGLGKVGAGERRGTIWVLNLDSFPSAFRAPSRWFSGFVAVAFHDCGSQDLPPCQLGGLGLLKWGPGGQGPPVLPSVGVGPLSLVVQRPGSSLCPLGLSSEQSQKPLRSPPHSP